MGYIKHHAIVVIGSRWSFDDEPDRATQIDDAYRAAVEAGCLVTPVVMGVVNSYGSFMVCPDGSKEGWEDSDNGDAARDRFVTWLREHSTPGEGWFSWAEVVVGSDDAEAHVERHAWDGGA